MTARLTRQPQQRRLGLALPPDRLLIRCAQHDGPTLAVSNCEQTFDQAASAIISDHYGLVADLTLPPQSPKPSNQPAT